MRLCSLCPFDLDFQSLWKARSDFPTLFITDFVLKFNCRSLLKWNNLHLWEKSLECYLVLVASRKPLKNSHYKPCFTLQIFILTCFLPQALQSNLKYSLLPRRLIISKRLSQCLHPALPSGVHLKALETYEIIFKIIGTKWLAKDLFLYR